MASKMVTETISKLVIKPSSPTPESLRHYNLSSVDQIMPSVYGSLAFFYPDPCKEISTICEELQNSLAKTLSHYYPFAGKLIENDYIDCNDQGVEFVQVRINFPMSDILRTTKSEVADLVFPREVAAGSEDYLVVVQLSQFDCGGIGVGLCVSNKVADASTIVNFMVDWASSARISSHMPTPVLLSDSVFPHGNGISPPPFEPSPNCVARKFLFSAQEIEKLKSMVVESGIDEPTSEEVVAAVLYHSAINCGSSKAAAVLIGRYLLRPLFELSENSVGNMTTFYFCINSQDEKSEFPALVGKIKKAKLKLATLSKEEINYDSQFKDLEKCLSNINNSSFEVYLLSTFCGSPIYEVDFGWGKPIRVTRLISKLKDLLSLMDSPEGGIETLVILDEEKMAKFEKNQLLLSYASLI